MRKRRRLRRRAARALCVFCVLACVLAAYTYGVSALHLHPSQRHTDVRTSTRAAAANTNAPAAAWDRLRGGSQPPWKSLDRLAEDSVTRHPQTAASIAATLPPEAAQVGASEPASEDDVPFDLTVVTQTDAGRLAYVAECARRWDGPLAAAVYVDANGTASDGLARVLSVAGLLGTSHGPGRGPWPAHALGGHVTLVPVQPRPPKRNASAAAAYPINKLRNAAIGAVRTSHFLMLDADLWPSAELRSALAAVHRTLLGRKRVALVVPAFQARRSKSRSVACSDRALRACAPCALSLQADIPLSSAPTGSSELFARVPRDRDGLDVCLSRRRCSHSSLRVGTICHVAALERLRHVAARCQEESALNPTLCRVHHTTSTNSSATTTGARPSDKIVDPLALRELVAQTHDGGAAAVAGDTLLTAVGILRAV